MKLKFSHNDADFVLDMSRKTVRDREAKVEHEIEKHHATKEVRTVPAGRREPNRGVLEMRVIWTSLKYSSRSCTSVSTILLFALAMCLSARVASAQAAPVPTIVMSQVTVLGAFPSGGTLASANPAGNSFAVNSKGDIITGNTYGNQVLLFNGQTGAVTVLGSYANVGPVTLDKQNNLYIGGTYTNNIVKVPYNSTTNTYAAISAPASATSPAVCTGSDTTECNFGGSLTSAANGYYFGVVSMTFDSQGDFFYGLTNGNTAPNAIFECSAACLSTGTPGPVLLYQEPTSATPTTTGQLNIGALAVDAYGDLFFTDSAVSSTTSEESFSSNLNELVYTSGTGYATVPTVLYAYTPATVAQYDAEIDGVATDANGTVYFLLQDTGGIFAFPSNKGVVNTAKIFTVSTQSGKSLAIDSLGNFYVDSYINAEDMIRVSVNNLTATATAVATPSTATNLTTVLNDGACSTTPVVTFTATQNGTATTEFAAATTGTCASTMIGGSSYATTLTFTPTVVGTSSATLAAVDTNSGSGTATVTGNATGTVATPAISLASGTYTGTQTVTITDATVGASIYYTDDGSTPTASSTLYSGPISVAASETLNAIAVDSGDTSSAVATATYIINLAPPAATPAFSVAAGTYTTPQQVTLTDATAGAAIYYTTDGSTPTASSTLYSAPITVSATETINAIAVATGYTNSAVASTAYTINLPPSVFQNVVMSQETELGAYPSGGGQSGSNPAGGSIAVNSYGNVIAGNTYGSEILLYSGQAGGVSPLPKPTVLGSPGNPSGVAVDSQNNLYVGNAYNTAVLKVPFVGGAYVAMGAPVSGGNPYPAGTPNCTGHDTVECVMNNLTTSGSGGTVSLAFDAKGDLFYSTTNSGTAANSIWECTAACLYTGTPAATLVYQEPTSTSGTTTGQLNIGGMSIDPFGDLFFTDSAVNTSSNDNQESFSSNLKELVYTSGTGFATTPTILYNYAPASPSNYDAEIDGVATDASGTVYALLQNTGGILAFPNKNGVIDTAKMYLVSTVTGKLLAIDTLGNLYVDAYISGDAIVRVGDNNLTATATAVGAPSTATFTTVLNDGGCSPTPTVSFVAGGTNASAFSAATTGTCSSTLVGASFATTLTFTPAAVGTSSATLTATDSLTNTGTAAVTGNGTGTVATPAFSVAGGTYTAPQTVAITDATAGASIYYTTDGSTPGAGTGTSILYSGPITVSTAETLNAIAVDSGDTSSAIATAAYIINLPGGAATPVFSPVGGTYTTPQSVSITDATTGAAIYYTTNGSAPTASSTLYTAPIIVSSTETINAIAVATGYSNSAVAAALYTINLPASAFQNVVMSQSTLLGALPSNGGAQSGGEPAGDTMAVNSNGDVIATNTYGNDIVLFTPQGATPTLLGSISNPNGVAVDSQNNLFLGASYNSTVLKIPYVNGTYATIAATTGSTPNCTGTDTVECIMTSVTLSKGSGVVSMVFDSKGDLFFGTTNQNQGGNNANSIYECTAACLYTGSPAPTLLFAEPTASAPNTTGQLSIGGMAIDASGNLFFTDSAIGSASNQESFTSNLNELPYTSGTGYAKTPTVIYNFTPATPANYDAEIDGVATSPNGTVYALTQDTTGILAFPIISGTYSSKNAYLVSAQSGKLLTSDGLGNLYEADNGGNIYEIAIDNLTAPTTPVGNPLTATNVTTFLNDGGCTTTPPTVTFAATGTSASAFSAATTGTCTTTSNGASFATSVTFTPIAVGINSATLTATDSLKNTGTAVVSGVGTPAPPAATPAFSVAAGTYTTVQTVTITDTTTGAAIYYTTDGSTPTTKSTLYSGPVTVGVTETLNAIATATGFASSPVASALYTINLPTAATPTFSVAAGTYTTPQTITITDATTGAAIHYTTDGSTPTASSTLYTAPITVGVTETINAIAVATNYNNSAVGSAAYTINLPAAATPAFSLAAGTYTTVQSITITDSTTGAAIYYTTDGSTPTAKSTLYSGAITVAVSTTINAIAIDPPNYNNSAIATAAYVINLPQPAFTITSSSSTVTVPPGGIGTVTLTITANAAFNGSMSFACSGFLPVGATCAFAPASVTLLALGTSTTTLTVAVPALTAALHHGPSPLLPSTMLAAALCFLGLRKRRRLQMLLLFVVSAIGLTMFNGCTTTSSSSPTSSQMVVTGTGASCPVTDLTCATNPQPGGPVPTPASANLPLILTVQ
jgi:hypothetical protein